MTYSVNLAILIGAGLIVVSVFTSLISRRIGAPLLLIFLGIGLLAGEDGILGIDFDDGPAAYFIGSLALAIILFDSGFETRLRSYRVAAFPALTLATVGVLLTAGLLGLAAIPLLGLGWVEALLLGSIIASTDAAAVFFLLRVGGINLRERVSATLEIESGTNDPMAVFLTLILVELAAAKAGLDDVGWDVALSFLTQLGIGLPAGVLGGFAIAAVLGRIRNLDSGLYPIASLAMALVVFAATGLAGGSGFLAAYVAGLVAGNLKVRHAARLRRFQLGMTWLAQIGMFLTLGLLATPSQFGPLVVPSLLLAVALILVARPLAVWLCLLPFGFSRREIAFTGWVGLRGAVSILLAILPTIGGVENGQLYFNVVFIMVLASLLIQGWTVGPMARWLKLAVPPRTGPVDRQELELPGGTEHELVGYRIHPDSAIAKGERVPRWARPVLILRGGKALTIHNAGALRPNDQVYLFAAPRQIDLLDKVYAGPSDAPDPQFYGDFPLSAGTTLGDVTMQYGISLDGGPEIRLGDLLTEEFNGRPEVGDRLPLGPVELVVRALGDGGGVTEVGIILEPGRDGDALRWLGRLRRWLAVR